MAEEQLLTCEACGATVYPEHVQTGRAHRVGGRLFCPHCVHEVEALAPAHAPAISAADEETLEPLPLVDMPGPAAVQPAAAAVAKPPAPLGAMTQVWNEARFHRPLAGATGGATRCRIFHAKLNDGALAFMNDQINAWTDANPDIHIKFGTSTIGVFEGKHSDPNLIVTIFY